jgi:SAM-dependent methyltransferase
MDLKLLRDFLRVYAFQPATAFFRAIEVAALIELGIPVGVGVDIGCGDGRLTEILIRRIGWRDLVGVDPDPREAAEARRRNFYTAVHTTGGERIPEVDGRFDFTISNSVLEHVPRLDSVLAEVSRVLKHGGIFCLTVPHAGFRTQLAGPLIPRISRAEYETRLDQRLAHVNYLSAAEWRALLDRHGFATEVANFYVDRAQLQRWETISRWTAGVLDAASGGRMHPVAIQRSLGLRQFQNGFNVPRPCAAVLARLFTLGVTPVCMELTEETSACVAIRCRKL